MSKIAETFDDFRTKVLQNLGFRGVRVRIHCACAWNESYRHVPGKSDGTRRTPLWTHCVDSFDLLKNPIIPAKKPRSNVRIFVSLIRL